MILIMLPPNPKQTWDITNTPCPTSHPSSTDGIAFQKSNPLRENERRFRNPLYATTLTLRPA